MSIDLLLTGVRVLGWCLLHFVWQAAAVGTVYAVMRACLPRGKVRYLAGMLALFALAACPMLTAWHELRLIAPVDLGAVSAIAPGSTSRVASSASPGMQAVLQGALPWLVLAWACGVAFLTLRVFRQWRGLRALVRAADALPAWRMRAQLLALRLRMRRVVNVLASVRIATPTLVGWLKPVIVMPLAILDRLPPEQIELILAHELAHLRRLDHLANCFQVVLETLLFYHPVVHWISRDVRNERELCCDTLALQVTDGDRRDFVAALAGLQEFREEHGDLVLAASGGVLLERAWFIAGAAPARSRFHARLVGTLVALLGVVIVLGAVWRQDALRKNIADAMENDTSFLQRVVAITVQAPALAVADFKPQRLQLALTEVSSVAADANGADSADTPKPVEAAPIAPTARSVRVADLVPAAMTALAQPLSIGPSRSAVAAPDSALPLQPVRIVRPIYPERALERGVEGAVVVEFDVDAQGNPENLDVVGSTPSDVFNRAALQALGQWQFRPGPSSGQRYRQTFTFALNGAAVANDVIAAEQSCYVTTGTHICRHFDDTMPGLKVIHPAQ